MNCSGCGETNPAHARFCLGCGTPFGSSSATPSGSLRRVSVLFADVAGSTALVVDGDPEDARARLDAVLEAMIEAVHRYGGMVGRIAGDGIMALFGALGPQEDHPRCACLAALRMQGEWARRQALGLPDAAIRIRVGINAGDVLLRMVVNDLRTDYSVDGPTTHIAAKVEQAARPGTIRVTAAVAQLVDGFIETRSADPVAIAGLAEPVSTFELVRATEAQSRFQVAAARGLTRFMGRAAELDELLRSAELARQGQGRAVAVLGDAGVGKSRLLWELEQRLRDDGWAVLRAPATVRGARSAYFAFASLLGQRYGLDPGDATDTLAQRLAAADPPLDVPALLAVLDRPGGEPGWLELDAARRAARTRQALADALVGRSTDRPTALSVEDLHEADSESREFVAGFIARLADSPTLLLLESRPDPTLAAAGTPGLEVLQLPPLSDATCVRLFRELAGTDASLAALEQALVERVGGNAFFLEESVRLLSESGGMVRGADGLRVGGARAALPMPERVRDVLESRLARLPPREREVLELASVFGKRFGEPLLRHLAQQPDPSELYAIVARLVEAGLLAPVEPTGPRELAFRHAYTQEAVYDGITRARRRALHARVVDVLNSAFGNALAERVELLAHHAVRAEAWHQAIGYLQQAARRAAERSALREAVRLLDEALGGVGRLGDSRRAVDAEVELRLMLRTPLLALGNIKRMHAEVARLEALTPQVGDQECQARIEVLACGHRWMTGEPAAAVVSGRRAIELAAGCGSFVTLVPARQYVGGALHEMALHAEAWAALGANVAEVPEDAPGHLFGMAGLPAVFCRSTRAWSYEHVGDFAAAETDVREASRIAAASRHGFSILSACFAAGSLQLALERPAEAEAHLDEGYRRCRAERQRMWTPLIGSMLALAQVRQGRLPLGARTLDEAVAAYDEPALTTFTLLTIASVYAETHRPEPADRVVRKALQRARRQRERISEAKALLLCGRLAADAATADAHAAAALAMAERWGLRPLAARARFDLAARSAAAGSARDAPLRLHEARQAFAALGLPVPAGGGEG